MCHDTIIYKLHYVYYLYIYVYFLLYVLPLRMFSQIFLQLEQYNSFE